MDALVNSPTVHKCVASYDIWAKEMIEADLSAIFIPVINLLFTEQWVSHCICVQEWTLMGMYFG